MKTAREIATDAMTGIAPGMPVDPEIVRELIETVIEADRAEIEKYLDAAEHPDDWGVTCVYTSRLRANLGLPQSVRDQDFYDENGVAR